MKKLIVTIAFILVITIVACGVIACKEKAEETQPDNTETVPSNMHTVTIDTVEKFNHYFTYETRVSEPYYGDTITSTITVTSKLKGFVEYSGEVLFSASSEKEDVSEQVLKERKLSIDSYGDGEDVYELTKDSRNPISFSEVSFDVKSVNITATYHYEGASGNSALSYQRVSLTNYNYKEYVTLESTVNSNDENYYLRISVSAVKELNGLYEFNNVVLTFDNGATIKLDALGYAEYQSENMTAKPQKPKLTGVAGSIDFYPSATYQYQNTLEQVRV